MANYDVELISMVKEHEFIYNPKHQDYRNLPLRANIWTLISRDLNIDDRKLSSFLLNYLTISRFLLDNLVQKRWKVLREKYSVAYRKLFKDESTTPSWPLFDSCAFLQPFVNVKAEGKKEVEEENASLVAEKQVPIKSPFDENILTQLVRERPVLYDKRHEDFRSPKLRNKAWNEISAISGWDTRMLQKRWRVMRDRFVRDLRRTKNNETDRISCSAFFRDMLFLVNHVRSKRYEVETAEDMSDSSHDQWQHTYSEDDTNHQTEDIVTCVVENTKERKSPPVDTYELSDTQEYGEYFDSEHAIDNDTYEEVNEVDDQIDELYDAEEESFSEEQQQEMPEESIVAVENISKEQWINEGSSKKHRISSDSFDEPASKRKTQQSESSSVTHREEESAELDENAAFGRTIGLMLKKYPSHLQTAVKLELLQSLANFDIKHKLVVQN